MAKIRNGFVSNSSSTSFIIGVKGKGLSEALGELKEKYTDPENPFSLLIDGALDSLKGNSEEISKEGLLDRYCYDTMEDFVNDCGELGELAQELFENGFKVYEGSVSDDCGSFEAALCDVELDYSSDTLKIWKEAGY